MLELSVIPIYVVSLLVAIGCAVDALTWHPYEWCRAGGSQMLRLGVITGPLFSLFCPLPGVILGLTYLIGVRRQLSYMARVPAHSGQPPVRRRPVLGLDWAWCSLRPGQRAKLVLSGPGAMALELALFWFAPQPDNVPRWLNAVLIVLLWPTFLVLVYFMLTALRHMIPLAFSSPGRASARQRMDAMASAEYHRRITEFQQKHEPPQPWDQSRAWPPQR